MSAGHGTVEMSLASIIITVTMMFVVEIVRRLRASNIIMNSWG